MQLLFPPTLSPYALPPLELVQSASRLLVDLHRTGAISSKAHLQSVSSSGGANNSGLGFVYEAAAGSAGNTRATQAQLWRATIDQALGTFELFASSCVSSILPSSRTGKRGTHGSSSSSLPTFPIHADWRPDEGSDSILEHAAHLTMLRYALFILLEILQQPSAPQAVVQLPLSSFMHWTLSSSTGILRMTKKYSVQNPGSETSLFVLQMTSLSSIVQTSVLTVLLKLLSMAGRGAALEAIRVQQDGEVSLLGALVDLVEGTEAQEGSVPDDSQFPSLLLRSVAFLVAPVTASATVDSLEGLALPLEPSSRTARRLARISASTLARFLLGTLAQERRQPTLDDSGHSGSRSSKKRAKADAAGGAFSTGFDTDTVFGSAHVRAPVHVTQEEAARVMASCDILGAVYSLLTASITGEQIDLATMSAALAKASVEALLCSGVVLVSASSSTSSRRASSSSAATVTQDMLAASSLRLLDTVLRHSTSKTLAAVLTGTSAMLCIAADKIGRVGQALRKCMHTIQLIAQPRMIPVPEWNLEIQDVSMVLQQQRGGAAEREMETALQVEDSLQSGWLRSAAREVLDLEFPEQEEAATPKQAFMTEPSRTVEATSAIPVSPPRYPSTLVRSSPRNFSPDPVKIQRSPRNFSPDPVKIQRSKPAPSISTATAAPAISKMPAEIPSVGTEVALGARDGDVEMQEANAEASSSSALMQQVSGAQALTVSAVEVEDSAGSGTASAAFTGFNFQAQEDGDDSESDIPSIDPRMTDDEDEEEVGGGEGEGEDGGGPSAS